MRTPSIVIVALCACGGTGETMDPPIPCGPNGECPAGYICDTHANICERRNVNIVPDGRIVDALPAPDAGSTVSITASIPAANSAATATQNRAPSLSGSAEANATITLFTTPGCTGTSVGSGTANDAGLWGPIAVTSVAAADGLTTYYAQATGEVGNPTCSQALDYYTDNTGPAVSITQKPADPSHSTGASFVFSATDMATPVTVECKLDQKPATPCTSSTTMTYPGPGNGRHTFTLSATDGLGNGSSASYAWDISASNVMFVTSVTGSGDLGSWPDAGGKTGLAAADNVCQVRADVAGLTGTFVAWLSSSTDDAYCRVQGFAGKVSANCGQTTLPTAAGPWARRDDFPFSEQLSPFVRAYSPPLFNETGDLLPVADSSAGTAILTNTTESGTASSITATCADWTTTTATDILNVGHTHTVGGWSTGATRSCSDVDAALACFQTGHGPPLPPHAASGKRVFVTSTGGTGDLSSWAEAGGNVGVSAGDAVCRARATAAGLANPSSYRAWLSTRLVNAIDRLTWNGPWIRGDGVVIASTKADLTDGSVFSSLMYTETNTYVDATVWTGTGADGLSASTCGDWTSGTSGTFATFGRSDSTTDRWTSQNLDRCDQRLTRLYCFED